MSNIRTCAFLALVALSACASAKPVTLPQLPAQSLPVTVKVPVLTPLPFAMTQPCPDPTPFPLATDAALIDAADAWKVAKRCSDRKLHDIQAAQPAAQP